MSKSPADAADPAVIDASTEVKEQIRNLRCDVETPDWGAIVYDVCETGWSICRQSNHSARGVRDELVAFLNDSPAAFSIARQSIPALRTPQDIDALSNHQKYIVEKTRDRAQEVAANERTQSSFDSAEYSQEKRIIYEMQLHRASLSLHYSDKFDPEQKQKLIDWLESMPI